MLSRNECQIVLVIWAKFDTFWVEKSNYNYLSREKKSPIFAFSFLSISPHKVRRKSHLYMKIISFTFPLDFIYFNGCSHRIRFFEFNLIVNAFGINVQREMYGSRFILPFTCVYVYVLHGWEMTTKSLNFVDYLVLTFLIKYYVKSMK